MTDEFFSETTGSLARKVPCLPATVRKYCDDGLIESRCLPNGTRLFKPTAAEQVRKILAEHLARCGRRAAAA